MKKNDSIGLDIDNILQEQDSEKNQYEILKLLSDEHISRVFSELSDKETKIATRILFLHQLLNSRFKLKTGDNIIPLDDFIMTFLKMRVNKDRKSRGEFVESFKSERLHDMDKGLMNSVKKLF